MEEKKKEKAMDAKEIEIIEISSNCHSEKITDQKSSEKKSLKFNQKENVILKYPMWNNISNLCWLNSSMILLAHSKILRRLAEDISPSQIYNILLCYKVAIAVMNGDASDQDSSTHEAGIILTDVRKSVFEYLRPIIKCVKGKPDSAFCALLNLISENKEIQNLFKVEFTKVGKCANCCATRVINSEKTIITLSKIQPFNPIHIISLSKCPVCEVPDQELRYVYKTLPQCLMFHFEKGAGRGIFKSLDFKINDREYKLTGFIKLVQLNDPPVGHFIASVRKVFHDNWMDCDDLIHEPLQFYEGHPYLNLRQIHILMFEAMDNKGTIPNASYKDDSSLIGDCNSSNIPIIDLSD
ncbi:SUMO-specific isopeptidase USPL1 [Caerostris darwini]|uniref:SUMO-specific isopeptidase USPL1 n=1 Tax=Caerostris darwini TaxID=1538125 RepID=A0AAV4PE77_9ARAC|nr:SUMO-specific isopeptidase USPL1 [Caerostris darwini]